MSFTVKWCIENFFLYWKNKKEALVSSEFIVGCLDNTKWNLSLYKNEVVNYIGIFLQSTDALEDSFDVNFQFSALTPEGTSLTTYDVTLKSLCFGVYRSVCIEVSQFIELDEILKKSAAFSPNETLIVQCQLWNNEKQQSGSENCVIRTRVNIEHNNFVGTVQKFSTLPANQKMPFVMKSESNKCSISMNITVSDKHSGECITVGIIPISDFKIEMATCKFYILDATGKKVDCGQDEESLGSPTKFLLFFTKSQLLARNHRYLPNDVLTLGCECIFFTGEISHQVQEADSGPEIIPIMDHINSSEMLVANTEDSLHNTNDLKNDLQCLYNDGFSSDVKLRSDAETFSVHRLILSARSPVFKAMFSNEMREKSKECIEIPDIDSATMGHLLLYLYTNTLENLQWQPASKLYIAADKYAVVSLRNKCSSILKRNLCPSNACEILVLSDMHNDEDLKKYVQNFILNNDKILFISDEWKDLMKDYLHLASEIMYMDLLRKIGQQKN